MSASDACGSSCPANTRLWQRLSLSWLVLPLDLRGLAMMRIIFGLLVVYEQLCLLYWQTELLSDVGFCSRAPYFATSHNPDYPSFTPYYGVGRGAAVTMLILTHAAAALSVALGFCTFRSCVLLWVLHRGRMERFLWLSYAADGLACAICYWSMWLPVGQRYSLDALNSATDTSAPERDHAAVKQRGPVNSYVILFCLAMMYGQAGYFKVGDAWINGSAAERALTGTMRRTHWIARALASSGLFSKVFAIVAVIIQRHLWICFFVPHDYARFFSIAVFGLFHISLWLTMRIDLFQPFALCLLVACFPACAWDCFDTATNKLMKALSVHARCVVKATPAASKLPTSPPKTPTLPRIARVTRLVSICFSAGRVLKSFLVGLTVFAIWSKSCQEFVAAPPGGWPGFCSAISFLHQPVADLQNSVPYVRKMFFVLDKWIFYAGSYQKFSVFSPEPSTDFWWVRIVGMSNNGSQLDLWVDGEPCFEPPTAGGSKHCGRPRLPYLDQPEIPFGTHRLLKNFESGAYRQQCIEDFRAYICNSWHARNAMDGPWGMPFFRVLHQTRPATVDSLGPTTSGVSMFGSCYGNFNPLISELKEPRDYDISELCDLDARLAYRLTGNPRNLALPVCVSRLAALDYAGAGGYIGPEIFT
eukprot:TRINITY_DN37080_c0_g2_i1.p1 TRINITY_DN37080_c0_g2~~TRINITY_DN37080_c0_g2_i1.p1  ORF type:complete len:645 (-),score=54.99 TRINITY_DN37080_c0_g2_i1:64-1998(-)